MDISVYFVLELLGTAAFAVSGAMVAIEKKMDILGVIILGMTTAIGGGVIRDVLMGNTPPTGLADPLYALLAIAVSACVFIPAVRKKVNVDGKLLVVIDALGLGTFTVLGIRTAAGLDSFCLRIFLGVLTGVGGGVLRDVFAAQRPMIFVRHFYAAASLLGAVLCALVLPRNENLGMLLGIVLILILRILAAKYKWHLPKA